MYDYNVCTYISLLALIYFSNNYMALGMHSSNSYFEIFKLINTYLKLCINIVPIQFSKLCANIFFLSV